LHALALHRRKRKAFFFEKKKQKTFSTFTRALAETRWPRNGTG
jgi:hypothetical protein